MRSIILLLLFFTTTISAQCPTAVTQPQSFTYGTTKTATFVVSGGQHDAYKWQYYTGAIWLFIYNSLPVGATYRQSDDTLYMLSPPTYTGAYTYRCRLTSDTCAALYSSSFVITKP